MRSDFLRCSVAAVCLTGHVVSQTLLQPSPLPTLDLPLLTAPVASWPADIDGDGDQDLLVRESSDHVILRRQPGGFVREPVTLPDAAVLLLVDLDADGFVDLVHSASASFGQLRVWWGDGSGTFPTPNPTSISMSQASGAVAGDMDNDGDLDLVLRIDATQLVRNTGGRTLSLAPHAQYGPPSPFSAGAEPFLIDVDQDGWLDVVLVAAGTESRIMWNNSGNFVHSFPPTVPVIVLDMRGVVAADFDGDGDRDLVFGGRQNGGVLMRNIGPRTFSVDPNPPTGLYTLRMLAYDADGDLDVDLHVFGEEQDELRLNDGTGIFTPGPLLGTNDSVSRLASLDLDGDGDTDHLRFGFASGLPGPAQTVVGVSYEVRPGQFDFVGGSRLPIRTVGIHPNPPVDLDGDGWVDLLLQSAELYPGFGGLQIAKGGAGGVFRYRWADRDLRLQGFFADVNGDQSDDYVQLPTSLGASWAPNVGGTLAATAIPLGMPIPNPNGPSSGAGGDLDGDGDVDLLFVMPAGGGNCRLRMLSNLGNATFVEVTSTNVVGPVATGTENAIAIADFDGDQDLDVWVRTFSQQQIWRNQNGVLSHAPAAVPGGGTLPGSTVPGAVGDIDGDGDLDLNLGNRWLRNQGNGNFVPTATNPTVGGTNFLPLAGDLDDDGDLDLIGQGAAAWNNGLGAFSAAIGILPFAMSSGLSATHALDLDGDGDCDVLAKGPNSQWFVFLNMLRQTKVLGASPLGGNLELRITTRPGSTAAVPFVWIALATATAPPVDLPGLGRLQLDPLQATLVGGFAMPAAGGEQSWYEAIPNTLALRGVAIAAQTIELRNGRLRLGNLVTALLGR